MNIKEIKVNNIFTKSTLPASDYSVNPYVGCPHACKYCYASFMKRFTNHSEAWGDFLDVKFWPKIKNLKVYDGKDIFISSVTDPYNPLEKIYQRTRTLLEQLQGSKANITIQTKSDLVLRDIELIKTFPNILVSFSINSLDENFHAEMDKAVSIERRLQAMKQLYEAGIKTACFISPIFPEITDCKAIIDRVKKQCNFIWLENLNLRGNYKIIILNYIKNKYPKLVSLYNKIYIDKDQLYWEKLDKQLKEYAKCIGLQYIYNKNCVKQKFDTLPVIVNYFYHEQIKKSAK